MSNLKTTSGGQAAAWLHKSNLLNSFNIGHRHLERWVAEGYIRTVKLDLRQQGRRLYNVPDLEHLLLSMSEGKEPRRFAGRAAI